MPESAHVHGLSAPPPPPRRLKLIGLVALCIAAAVVIIGLLGRAHTSHDLKGWTGAQAIPTVNVIRLKAVGEGRDLVLPGSVQAFNAAAIHARVGGYIRRWYADIGQSVSAGQLLAEIDTPELDQQIAQARAEVNVALANQSLAQTTAQRWKGLLGQDAVSKQEADEKSGDLLAKSALTASARADLDRLQAMKGFARITAPFAGVVTSRAAEIGQLVAAGSPDAAPLYTVADPRRLRIYVRVPQSYTADIHTGMIGRLTVPEYPSRTFDATLVSTAQAVSDQSGTLLVELQIDNADHALKPGEYAQVSFDLPGATASIQVPASALLSRHSGMAVAVVGPDSRVHVRPVKIIRDLGSAVEVSGGVSPADRLIDNPADTLVDGDLVRVSGASAEAAAHG